MTIEGAVRINGRATAVERALLPGASMKTIHWQLAETETEREECYQIRGEYLRKYSPEHARLSGAELLRLREVDDYDSGRLPDGTPRTETYLIRVDGEAAATVRFGVVWTSESGSLGSYLSDLFDVEPAFLRLKELRGGASLSIAEVSRLAILRHLRKDFALPILKAMMACSYDVSRRRGVDCGVCMTPPQVTLGFGLIGAHLEHLADLVPRYGDPRAVRALVYGHRYYFPALRDRHPDVENPHAILGMSDVELLEMIRGEALIPRLYWSDRDRNVFIENDFAC